MQMSLPNFDTCIKVSSLLPTFVFRLQVICQRDF
jgi:hypothetical protein